MEIDEYDKNHPADTTYEQILATAGEGPFTRQEVEQMLDEMREKWALEEPWLTWFQRRNHEWRTDTIPDAGPVDQAGHTAVEAAEMLELLLPPDDWSNGLSKASRLHLDTAALLDKEVKSVSYEGYEPDYASLGSRANRVGGLAMDVAMAETDTAPNPANYDRQKVMEEAGDVLISHLSFLSMLDIYAVEAIEAAYEKNMDRDWEVHKKNE